MTHAKYENLIIQIINKINFIFILSVAVSALLTFTTPVVFGKEGPGRQKVIDFEDEVVEGMNKRPLDSFNQISEAAKKKKKSHLYRKRAGFKTETNQTLSEVRYLQ